MPKEKKSKTVGAREQVGEDLATHSRTKPAEPRRARNKRSQYRPDGQARRPEVERILARIQSTADGSEVSERIVSLANYVADHMRQCDHTVAGLNKILAAQIRLSKAEALDT